jgi:hypothetical protein
MQPADFLLVVEDRSAGGVRDRTDRSPPVHGGYTPSRKVEDCNGHERSPLESRNCRCAGQHTRHQAPLRRRAGVRVSLPNCREPLRALAHEAVVTEDGPHPLAELGAIAATSERRRSRAPCHPRAISSGHQRYPADSHGHSEIAAERAARA